MNQDRTLARVRRWQKRLEAFGISQFRVSVEITPHLPPKADDNYPGASAAEVHEYTDDVTFYFAPDENKGDELDYSIVHEWVHVAMRSLDNAMEAACPLLPEPAKLLYRSRLDQEREQFIERIARAIVDQDSA
jgi:hypothetical protein